jgi:hypothetical protein
MLDILPALVKLSYAFPIFTETCTKILVGKRFTWPCHTVFDNILDLKDIAEPRAGTNPFMRQLDLAVRDTFAQLTREVLLDQLVHNKA